ncbi:MAG: hypothetical protein JSV86_10600 [Gemmatimonadota bacterium]|nr:MAG: hypothetical protein JSV86_10600 [Gemmatimonadota bacterium]
MDHLKPDVFQWWDFFTYGLFAIFATVLGVLAVRSRRRNSDKKWWQWAGLAVVVAFFWFGYIMVLSWRADLADRVACVTKHGLVMVEDGGVVPVCEDVEAETERVLAAWDRAGVDGRSALNVGVMVFIKPMPFGLHTKPGKYAGFAKPYARAIAVGFDGRELSRTALAHELGHVILAGTGHRADERSLEDYHDRFAVPY